jgi:hypothetical protein
MNMGTRLFVGALAAANIIQPVSGRPGWSRLTMITQVDPGGFAPASIMNQVGVG